MPHGYSIADARDAENERDAASLDYALPHLIDQLVKVNVTGNDVILGVRYADERFRKVLVGQTDRPEKAPARRLLDALGDNIAAHAIASRECRRR